MSEMLSRGMFERYRDIKIAAELPSITDAMEFLLDKLKHSETNKDFFQSMNQ